MTKQCIEETIYDTDYQELFPEISSPSNIWNIYDDKCDKEESSSNHYTEFTGNICIFI